MPRSTRACRNAAISATRCRGSVELRHVLLGASDREKLAEPGAALVLEHDRGLQQIGPALRAAARIGAVTEGAVLPEDLLAARRERGRRRLARSRRRGFGRRLRGGVARRAQRHDHDERYEQSTQAFHAVLTIRAFEYAIHASGSTCDLYAGMA